MYMAAYHVEPCAVCLRMFRRLVGTRFEPGDETVGHLTLNLQVASSEPIGSAVCGYAEDGITVDSSLPRLRCLQDLQRLFVELNALPMREKPVLQKHAAIAVKDLPRRSAPKKEPSPFHLDVLPSRYQVGNPVLVFDVFVAPVFVAHEGAVIVLDWAHVQRRTLMVPKRREFTSL